MIEKTDVQQEWRSQSDHDIYREAEYDWTPTNYEVMLKDGAITSVMSFMDEDSTGGYHQHLVFTKDDEFDDYDTDDIVKWRKIL